MTTKQTLREEWSKEVDTEMPNGFVVDAERQIANFWLNKREAELKEILEEIKAECWDETGRGNLLVPYDTVKDIINKRLE